MALTTSSMGNQPRGARALHLSSPNEMPVSQGNNRFRGCRLGCPSWTPLLHLASVSIGWTYQLHRIAAQTHPAHPEELEAIDKVLAVLRVWDAGWESLEKPRPLALGSTC